MALSSFFQKQKLKFKALIMQVFYSFHSSQCRKILNLIDQEEMFPIPCAWGCFAEDLSAVVYSSELVGQKDQVRWYF